MELLTVQYKKGFGGSLLALGLVVLPVNLLIKDWANVAGAMGFIGLALWFLTAPAVVITATTVERRTPLGAVGRRHTIDGLADLRLEGRTLRRVSDGQKVAHLGWALRPEGLASLDFRIRKTHAPTRVAARRS